jgi:hypothetical protein
VIAVCGPGRTLRTALLLLLSGEQVTEITESAHLPDPDLILLIDPDPVFELSPRVELLPPPPDPRRQNWPVVINPGPPDAIRLRP